MIFLEARIKRILAKQRHKVFTDFKNPGLKQLTRKKETKRIFYDPIAFKHLLEDLVANPKWDGIRVYFANYQKTSEAEYPSNTNNKFVLIFVPTQLNESDKAHYDVDDQYRIIDKNDNVKIIDYSKAQKWVNAYHTKKEKFELDARNNAEPEENSFNETNCIWYAKSLIQRSADDKRGMLDFIDKLGDDLENVIMLIGGYLTGERLAKKPNDKPDYIPPLCEYQLTLIFRFQIKDKSIAVSENTDKTEKGNFFFSLAYRDFSKNLKEKLGFVNEDADTGDPCPPPRNGCKGAKLL